MEEICAAQAMGWNVELDRGLRSNKPGANIEAIMKMGPRLYRWSEECPVTALTASLFKLDSGQDKAFANSILLRLVDAFRTGNNFTRLCVLKVFLLELKKRCCHDKGNGYKGILAKERIPNHVEIVKRVKEVFNSGDIVARALPLRVLGCLVDLVKDSAEIQRLIIDAMDSPYLLEVNAAIFAAGCLCEFSEDFSSIILKKVIEMVNAMKTIPETKAGFICLLAKMVHSPTLAYAAQEAGKSLMLKLPTDEIVTSTLLSLSKLAIGSVVTLPDQVDLLLSYVESDPRYIVRAMSLKCFRTLSAKATRCVSFKGKGFRTLLTLVKDISLPTALQCLALQILHKLCDHYVTYVDAHQLKELVAITEINCLHPDRSKREAAVSLLVDLTCNIQKFRKSIWDEVSKNQTETSVLQKDSWRITDEYKNENVRIDLPMRATLLVFDQIALAFNNPMERCLSIEQTKSFFNLISHLIGECSTVSHTVIDCIKSMLEALVKKEILGRSEPIKTEIAAGNFQSSMNTYGQMLKCTKSNPEGFSLDKQHSYTLDLMTSLCRCLLVCLDKLDMEGGLDNRIYSKVKQLTDSVAQVEFSSNSLCYLIPALLNSCQAQHFALSDETNFINDQYAVYDGNTKMEVNVQIFHDGNWVRDEKLSLEVATDMMNGRNMWRAYKIGIHAACCGAWFTASSIFQHLVERAQSETCYLWLRSLALWAGAENKVYAVLISLHGIGNLHECQDSAGCEKQGTNSIENMLPDSYFDVLSRLGEVMPEALKLNGSAINSLSAAVNLDRTFEFQRWFLNLRGRLMENTAELLGLLNRDSHIIKATASKEESDSKMKGNLCSFWKHNMQRIKSLKSMLLQFSSKFRRLANEFDLLNMSFINIDIKSFECISSFALYCSLLSFCTLFVIHFPKISIGEQEPNTSSNHVSKQSYVAVIQDLAQRLQQIDATTWEELVVFSRDIGDVNDCSMLITCMSSSGYQQRAILRLCRLAISGVLNLQEQARRLKHKPEFYSIWQNGLKLLGNVVLQWLHLPSHVPKYFFQTRPCTGVELFAANMDKRNLDGISVQHGYQLPLSICVQVKNILPGSSLKVRRICCFITVQPLDVSRWGASEYYARWRAGWNVTEEVLDMKEELLTHMRLKTKFSMSSKTKKSSMMLDLTRSEYMDINVEKSNQKVKTFVTFELDNKGQGFSMCLLDVSALPCGLYQTSWLCACLDNRGKFWSLQPLNAGPIFSIKP